MNVEVRPVGVKCNLQCRYCYEHPQREAGNVLNAYDLQKIKAAVEREVGDRETTSFSLHGGESLLMSVEDLEELWSWGLEKYGRNGIQTNGTLINDAHIRMFKRYHVCVGISVDGPGALNDARWAGTLERTREATARTHAAIERLCKEGIDTAPIISLHRHNAAPDKLPIMHEWIRDLERIGVNRARMHIAALRNESVRKEYGLSTEEYVAALVSFLNLEKQLTKFRFDTFAEMRKMLLGDDTNAVCSWMTCDVYTTRSVRAIEGDGQRGNCGHANIDGIGFVKSDTEGFERYIALYQTAQEHGGCKGCRFFLMCKGHCPGDGIDGDWRNRSQYCEVWKAVYRHLEKDMLEEANGAQVPLSVKPIRKQVEQSLLDAWGKGEDACIARVLEKLCEGQSATAFDDLKSQEKTGQGGPVREELQEHRAGAGQKPAGSTEGRRTS